MVQILPRFDPGADIGRGFGSGVGEALGLLAKKKFGLGPLEGLTPYQAATIDIKERKLASQLDKQRQKEALLSNLLGIPPTDIPEQPQQIPEQPPLGAEEGIEERGIDQQLPTPKRREAPRRELTDQEILAVGSVEPQLARILQKQKEAGTLSEREFQKQFLTLNLDYGKDLTKKAAESKRLFKGLTTLEDLVKAGATDNKIRNFLGKSENLRWMMDPGSVAFLSGLKDQFSDFKETFGSRPTQYEAKIFEKGLPSLMASKDGKLAAIEIQKAKRKSLLAKKKSFDKMNKKSGFRPVTGDFIQNVEQDTEKKVDKIYEDLKKNLFSLINKQKVTSSKNILIKNEATGETLEVPKESVAKFEKFGWSSLR